MIYCFYHTPYSLKFILFDSMEKHMNILLIEDDKDLCRALSCRLGQDGHRTDCCHNGREAELYIR